MRFEHRELLWYTLLLVPALTAFFVWSWRKRRQLIAQFVQSRLLAHLTVGVSARRQKLRMALLVAACASVMLVLARPQWGFSYEEARQRGLDVIVAVDTSRSMLAADVTPNRLTRAKLAALDLKRLARTDRVGLIAFAGSAFLQCPLSFDDEAFRQNINALDVNIIPQGGSALAEAIETARAAFERKNDNYKVLVLFTDGEDNAGEALDAAKKASGEGLRIFTVGVGTGNGELLRINDAKGRTDYIRDDQGNVVKSRLNEKLLRQIAEATHGFYMLLAGANTMDLLYERGLAPLPKAELGGRHIKKYHERYQWFLGLAIVLLLTEMFLPERKRVRRTEVTPAAVFARAALFLLLVATAAAASPAHGLKQYQAGQYQSALREYRNAIHEKKDDPRLQFNAGTSAYQAQNYEKAVEYLNSALLTTDPDLQERTYYNRGNAQYRLGEATSEPKEKTEQWEEAVSSYESALKLNPKDQDATFNLDLVKQRLEELKKQQQQQQDQQSKDDQKKDDKKKDDKNKQDQKDQNKQDQQQKQDKQDQSKSDESKQHQDKDQQQQQQDQAKKEDQKKQQQQQQSQAQKGDKDQQQQPQGEGNPMRAMPMTEQQAMQLLDMQKGEERAMIFIPQFKTNRSDRVLKDW
ncbi:MAG TPA: VWA domain-containing protein [Candidatus Binatia bacterium]|nr:VWA domain-containing protein [Candidatus Binatia bacterium]